MSNNVNNPWRWRVATTEAGLAKGSFAVRDIPSPSTCFYQKRTVENPQADGRQAVHGYQQATLLFDVLTGAQYKTIKDLIENQRETSLYLTIDRGDGTHSYPDWIDISGHPSLQISQSQAGQILGRRGGGGAEYRSVRLFVNNVVIINDPSVYTTP